MDKKTEELLNMHNPGHAGKERHKYFDEALSDFVYDAAGGRAVRHLTDAGYTADQIVQQLNYPVSMEKVKMTITRYLKETGTLTERLPVPQKCMRQIRLEDAGEAGLYACLSRRIRINGEENSFISCPFGTMSRNTKAGIHRALSLLTARERAYILGIAWEPETMYHILNRRMLEIGAQLAVNCSAFSFYFCKSREIVVPGAVSGTAETGL